ncbi:MAG: hypothetical protein R3F59_24385 [Myxococcota bacterium]
MKAVPRPTSLRTSSVPPSRILTRAAGDGEAQARAAEAAGDGAVGLAVGLEDLIELVGGDADARVAHREVDAVGLAVDDELAG